MSIRSKGLQSWSWYIVIVQIISYKLLKVIFNNLSSKTTTLMLVWVLKRNMSLESRMSSKVIFTNFSSKNNNTNVGCFELQIEEKYMLLESRTASKVISNNFFLPKTTTSMLFQSGCDTLYVLNQRCPFKGFCTLNGHIQWIGLDVRCVYSAQWM